MTESAVVTVEERSRAKLSYAMDVIWSLATGIFLVAWLDAMHQNENGRGTGIFDPTFLNAGFCNAPYTQEWCARFDFSMAFLLLFAHSKMNERPHFQNIFYLFTHGYAHWKISNSEIDPKESIKTFEEVFLLAMILGAGPSVMYQTMTKAGKPKNWSLAIAILTQILLVSLFVAKLQRGIYALSYINVSITLCKCWSRLLIVGYTTDSDIRARISLFGAYYYSNLASTTLIVFTMWVEPTCCSSWYARAGGHFWFDVSLFVAMLVAIVNEKTEREPDPKALA
jgi:hypothetical protein